MKIILKRFQFRMQKQFIISAVLIFVCFSVPSMVQADIEDSEEQNSVGESAGITSIDAIMMGKSNGRAIATAAEYCMRNEQYDKAIKLSRMALDKNYDDNEIHQTYAEALEGKLSEQVDKDPALYNECVKEWLSVLRQEHGEEKLTYHGIGIPVLGKFYEDDERVIPARNHLLKLTGTIPKVWETDTKYLKRVALGNNKLSGKVLKDDKASQPSVENK